MRADLIKCGISFNSFESPQTTRGDYDYRKHQHRSIGRQGQCFLAVKSIIIIIIIIIIGRHFCVSFHDWRVMSWSERLPVANSMILVANGIGDAFE